MPKGKPTTSAKPGGESVAGYWKRILQENPRWLNSKNSNKHLQKRWLGDHRDHDTVPPNVLANLSNVKSQLRSARRKHKGKKAAASNGVPTSAAPFKAAASARPAGGLSTLEEYIDECLLLAKNLDRPGLEAVIRYLRQARNQVVWKLGE